MRIARLNARLQRRLDRRVKLKTLFKEVNSMIEVISSIILIVSGYISSSSVGQSVSAEPKPTNAVEGLIEAFDRFPLVALGEVHGSRTQHQFIASLIKHPSFANKVNDIVVEIGNAKYQPIMDRYLAGETVAYTELRQVWRNTTQTTMVGDIPLYEQFFAMVRAVNQRLPKPKRLRVLLGDPPVDWSRSDIKPEMFEHDRHFASVVEQEVLSKGRRALMISGSAHMRRCCLGRSLGATALIEKAHPGAVFVVMTHHGFLERNEELEKRLASWPRPGLALVKNTWLGNLSPLLFLPGTRYRDPSVPRKLNKMKFQDVADAYIYLGPKDSLQQDTIPPEVQRDEEYQRELERRRQLKRAIFQN
jgi:hypothetical protein